MNNSFIYEYKFIYTRDSNAWSGISIHASLYPYNRLDLLIYYF